MDDVSRFIEALKDTTARLRDAELDPTTTRVEARGHVMHTAMHVRTKVLALAPSVFPSLEADERQHVTAGLQDIATQLVASLVNAGEEDEARAVLKQTLDVLPKSAVRPLLDAASRDLPNFTKAIKAIWLERKDFSADAVRLADEVRKQTQEPSLIETVAKIRVALAPLTRAPVMQTINGIGTSLYGHSDERPDGSYVKTLYIVFLFFPVIPLQRYLVRDASEGGWYFLAKAPLTVLQTWYRRLLVLGVLGAIGVSMVSAHFDSPTYRSTQALNKALESKEPTAQKQATTLQRALAEHAGTGERDAVEKVTEHWLSVRLAELPTTCSADTIEPMRRLLTAFGALPDVAKKLGAPTLAPRVVACAKALGLAERADVEAAASLLALARTNGLDKEVKAQTSEIERALSSAYLKEGWPLLAMEHALESDSKEALSAAAEAIEKQGDVGTLWVEEHPVVDRFLFKVRSNDAMKPLSTSLTKWAADAKALDKRLEADPLLTGDDTQKVLAACIKEPRAQAYCVHAARLLRAKGDSAGAAAALEKLGPLPARTSRAQFMTALVEHDRAPGEALRLLRDYVARTQPRFSAAVRHLDERSKALQDQLISQARTGHLPAALEKELNALPKEAAQERFGKWLREQLTNDASLAEARDAARRLSGAVEGAVELGTWQLEQASALTGAKRAALLQEAEASFLSVRDEAEGTPSFQMGYGQVLHRLGKSKEGDAALDELLKQNEPELTIGVASVYRDLGMNDRARELLRALHAKVSGDVADHVASLLSVMAPTLEDAELWLSKVKRQSEGTKASLAELKGRRLVEEGRFAEADPLFEQAQKFYAQTAKSNPVSANNQAVALQARFICTFDPKRIEEAVAALQSSLSSRSDEPLVVGNLAQAMMDSVAITTVDKLASIKQVRVSGSEAQSVLGSLLRHEQAKLRPDVKAMPRFGQALDLLRRHQTLAPQDGDAYLTEAGWRLMVGETEAGVELLRRARAASIVAEDRQATSTPERRAAGEQYLRKRLASYEGNTQATGAAKTLNLLLRCQGPRRLDVPTEADLDGAVRACRELVAATPGEGFEDELAASLAARALVKAAASNEVLKAALTTQTRQPTLLMVGWKAAHDDAALAKTLASAPEVVEASALLRTWHGKVSLSELAIAELAHDTAARDALKPQVDLRTTGVISALDAMTDPTDPNDPIEVQLATAVFGALPEELSPAWAPSANP